MKDRVTLTIDKNLLRQIDQSIDGTKTKNRSHAVELLLREALKGELPEQAVILGGGTKQGVEGNLREINGTPIIETNVELLATAGITHIIIITQDPDKIRRVLGDGTKYDINIQYITETTPLGTAGALHLAKPYLQGAFILTNGDEKKDVHIKDLNDFHKQHQGQCTIALTTVPDPSKYGVALLNGNRIITFVEKPPKENAPSNLVSAGLYILEPEVLNLVPSGYAKIETDIFPKLANEDKLYGYHFSGEYSDI